MLERLIAYRFGVATVDVAVPDDLAEMCLNDLCILRWNRGMGVPEVWTGDWEILHEFTKRTGRYLDGWFSEEGIVWVFDHLRAGRMVVCPITVPDEEDDDEDDCE